MKRQARLALAAFTIATLAFIAGRETAEGAYFDWGAGPLHWARTDTAEELRIAVYHDGVTTPEALVDAAAHLSTLAGVDVFVAGAAPPSVCEQYTQDFADYWVNPTTPGVITWCGGKSTNGHCGACTEREPAHRRRAHCLDRRVVPGRRGHPRTEARAGACRPHQRLHDEPGTQPTRSALCTRARGYVHPDADSHPNGHRERDEYTDRHSLTQPDPYTHSQARLLAA
jgi:hypothetical protein